MHKFMKIVGYGLALIGIAHVVKYFMHQEGCVLCGWHKTEVEEGKTKMEKEKETGSRYGSNPVKY